jgi:signal transduction histidine kinase
MNRAEWPGIKAGLKLMDKIIAADGRSIREGQDLITMVRNRGSEIRIHYTIESKGGIREVTIPTVKFGLNDFFMVFFIPFIGGFILLCLGFIVYILKPGVSTSWVFFLSSVIICIYMMTGFEIQSTYFFIPLHWLIIPFMPAALFHLGSIFPERKGFLTRYPALEYFNYLPALILAFLFELYLFTFLKFSPSIPIPWIPDIKDITTITRLYSFLCMAGLIILIFHSMYKSTSSVGKQRAKMILFGVTIGWFFPGMIMAVAHFMRVNFPWNFLPFLGIFFPASIAYSIVRHNLFDADAIIRRTVGYVVVTVVVVGAYIGISLLLNVFLGQYEIAQSSIYPIVFTVGIILVFNPLRNQIQSLVDRLFFRKEYDYGEIIDKIGNAITSSLDLSQILKKLVGTFTEDMYIDTSSVMLLNPAQNEYQVYLADGEMRKEVEGIIFSKDHPLVEIAKKEKKELTKYDVLEDPKYQTIRKECAKNFETLHASLIIPLVFQDELTGLMNLGEKKSGKFYNRQDVDLFRTLANQGAVAIENARLHQAKIDALEQSKKELEQLNKAKSRALDHLSHEIRTPLSVIQGNIRILKRKTQTQTPPVVKEEFFESLEKNLGRLSDIQQETDQIIRSYQELERRRRLVESDVSQPSSLERIDLYPFTEHIMENVKKQANHREIQFHLEGDKDLHVLMDPKILEDILVGLFKNAIENTPDEGIIRVVLEKKAQWIQLKAQDFGIGITNENQRRLFDGLFHTLDTELYSSKRPYDFGAGGKGLELLRMKVYGQRFGFDISVGSQRCIHIPTDHDLCPGRISTCPHCKKPEDCFSSGGSTFCISFPIRSNSESG